MRGSLMMALSASAVMIASLGSATALPINGGLNAAIDDIDLTQQAAVYIVEGRRHCFYLDGWRGAGWYRCGYDWRRIGLGRRLWLAQLVLCSS